MNASYILFFIVTWSFGVLIGYYVSQSLKRRRYRKLESVASEQRDSIDLFVERIIKMVGEGRFVNVSPYEIFSDNHHIFSEIETYRRLYQYNEECGIEDDEEVIDFRNRMFNVHTAFDSHELMFRAVKQVNFYSYFYYGNKVNKVFVPKRERFCKRKEQEGRRNRKDTFWAYRISNMLPSYLYKYRISRNGKSEILFVNALDIPGVGFRIAAFIINTDYRKMRNEYQKKMVQPEVMY